MTKAYGDLKLSFNSLCILHSFAHRNAVVLYVLILLQILSFDRLHAQTNPPPPITVHSENNQVIDATSDPAVQYLNGDVRVFHEGTFMFCDTAVLQGSSLRMYFNVVFMQNDTIRIYADSMHYIGDSLVAYFYGNIILENGPARKLYTKSLRYDTNKKIGYYANNGKLADGTATLISRSGRYDVNNKTAWFYQNVQVNDENFQLVTDSLSYNTSTRMTRFLAPVRIEKDTAQLYADSGWYDMDDENGSFYGNAQYLEKNTSARADTISYDGKKDIVILRSKEKQSSYIAEQDSALAREIYFDRKNDVFRLTGQAWYRGAENEVTGERVYYDKKNEKFTVSGRSRVSDPPNIIEADSLDYNKAAKYGKADGNVVWADTAARSTILADHILYRGEENFLLATNDSGRPAFMTEMDGDTLFLKADTLRSFRTILPVAKTILDPRLASTPLTSTVPDTLSSVIPADSISSDSSFIRSDTVNNSQSPAMDTIDYFAAYGDVRIFKSDLQGICDSLVFNKMDSVFTLFKSPFVWSDSTQIYGDTLNLLMRSGKINAMNVYSGATILSSEDLIFFNQIRGRYLKALFSDGKISRMDVDGSAQIVYYLTDKEKAYTGINTTEASRMTFLLEDNKVTEIKNYIEPKSKVIPMKDADHETLKVRGFTWKIEARPKDRSDL
jgi:lipopolysaccharide export system protein LptA